MFGSNTINSGLTFGKVLNGISKSLSIANQVIPLYQQAKPMINNAKTILGVLNTIKKDNKPTYSKKEDTIEEAKFKEITYSINSPTFFQ